MAKNKKQKPSFDYNQEVRRLREQGPERLYLLFGPEEYLRELFLKELRKLCVPSANEFSYRRMDGQTLELGALAEAVNAMPFFTERTFVEVRDFDLNRCRDAEWERLKGIVSDIPDWCTVAFVQSAGNPPDGRLAAVKGLKKLGHAVEVTEQAPKELRDWIAKRFRAYGKTISAPDAEYMLFLGGTRMSALIPEIEKTAAYAKGEAVTRADIDATVIRTPEAVVWDMIDDMALRRFDRAAASLSELLGNKENHPIALNALIGQQFRRLYAVKTGQEAGLGKAELTELSGAPFDSAYYKLVDAARAYSREELGGLVKLCAEYDFKMKSTGIDPYVLIRELFALLAAEDA